MHEHAVGVDRHHIRPNHAHFRLRAQKPHLRRDLPRQPDVVGVEQRDEFAARQGQAGVPRRRHAAIRPEHVADRRAVGFDPPPRVVGGPVVHNNQFQPPVRLAEDAVDGTLNDVAAVVRRQDNADEIALPGPGQGRPQGTDAGRRGHDRANEHPPHTRHLFGSTWSSVKRRYKAIH